MVVSFLEQDFLMAVAGFQAHYLLQIQKKKTPRKILMNYCHSVIAGRQAATTLKSNLQVGDPSESICREKIKNNHTYIYTTEISGVIFVR